jgi:hypothetical protein
MRLHVRKGLPTADSLKMREGDCAPLLMGVEACGREKEKQTFRSASLLQVD